MKIIEPKVALWEQKDPIAHVAKCARVCYGKTEGKSTDQQLYDSLLKAKHNSMFRHESVYAIIPADEHLSKLVGYYKKDPYIDIRFDEHNYYVATNGNWLIDNLHNTYVGEMIRTCRVTPEEFANTEAGHSMMRYTFHITTQISTCRELNRVSPNNIAERSTRYAPGDNIIVRPHWMSKEDATEWNENNAKHKLELIYYLLSCKESFESYQNLLLKCNWKREDARGVLPLDTATEVVYTYSVEEWKHIIALRSDKRAHPNAQIIANMIKKELEGLGYDF